MKKYLLCSGITLILAALFACASQQAGVTGIVLDQNHVPVQGAIVRVKATDLKTVTDSEGRFSLSDIPAGQPVFITAWISGYYINGVADVQPGVSDVEIILQDHHDSDNPGYNWLPSTYHEGQGENQGCAQCHSAVGTDLAISLPVDEWRLDAHAQSAVNARFLTMYTGTNEEGDQSPLTLYGYTRDYGRFPLRPDPTQPYYGPGYKLDFPDTAGNCAACHLPAASINSPYGTDPTTVSGLGSEGIPCDFCHKVWDVQLNPDTGLPFANMPGVLSFEFRRPPEGHQFFAGPFDDVTPGEDTFTPIQQQSQYCAPCHYGTFWDTTIYNSFGEWLESPYSDTGTGKTCQDCHMPHSGATYFALPGEGGTERNPGTIFSHLMPGASDETLLRNAVMLTVDAVRGGDQITVTVTILNDKTGHHVPTDSPLRQMILLVQAEGLDGTTLTQVDGPTVPTWGGVGDPAQGYYAGLPGQGYAKILMELWTEVTPTGAYWNPTRVVSDNRIQAMESDTSSFVFIAPAYGPVNIEVNLFFRRAFIELMVQKGWNTPDILMEQAIVTIPGEP